MFLGPECVSDLSQIWWTFHVRRACFPHTDTAQPLGRRAFLKQVWKHISSTILCLVPLCGCRLGLNSRLAWTLNAFTTEKDQAFPGWGPAAAFPVPTCLVDWLVAVWGRDGIWCHNYKNPLIMTVNDWTKLCFRHRKAMLTSDKCSASKRVEYSNHRSGGAPGAAHGLLWKPHSSGRYHAQVCCPLLKSAFGWSNKS